MLKTALFFIQKLLNISINIDQETDQTVKHTLTIDSNPGTCYRQAVRDLLVKCDTIYGIFVMAKYIDT